jgi:hypothetical protein
MSPNRERSRLGNAGRRVLIESRAFFLWGYLKVQVFTHTNPDINSIKMQFVRTFQDSFQYWKNVGSGVPRVKKVL